MSIETSIAALIAQAGQLLNLPQDIANAAQTQIVAIGNEYQARIANLSRTVYVHPVTGEDTNSGDVGSPVKSIQRALAMTPRGGMCRVLLQDAIIITQPIFVTGRELQINSDGAVRHAVSFDRELVVAVTPNLRQLKAFRLDGNASVNFSGVRINIPALDGTWPGFGDTGQSALISWSSSSTVAMSFVTIMNCDLDIPNNAFGALFDASSIPLGFIITSVTFVGQTTNLNGKVIRGYTSTAGTTPPRNLYTNLATI
jgi:hypothetical protein